MRTPAQFMPAARLAGEAGFAFECLPMSLRILLENVLANTTRTASLEAFSAWLAKSEELHEIAFHPSRILSHDTAGVAMLVDLAALRDRLLADGKDPRRVNPAVPIDLVVDHSVSVDVSASPHALQENARRELERNGERYQFLRWAEQAFDNLRVIPPGNGICHQVNMEYLARGVIAAPAAKATLISETLIGTDSHTTMINALGILGWGVGGIEAEAVALGQPILMSLPQVIGCRLVGRRQRTVSAADLALGIANVVRRFGAVNAIVEFVGEGLDDLSLGDRASLANMAPEYGATCGLFPVDGETLRYFAETGREAELIGDIEAHAHALGLWRNDDAQPQYSRTLTIDLSSFVPLVAGPRRPQELVPLGRTARSFDEVFGPSETSSRLSRGDVVIASITSCTHTSNAHQMIAAGLLARNAHERGLAVKPYVKTSLSPGSRVVETYLRTTGLQHHLDALGFHVTGFGCMTCAGNSGQLADDIVAEIRGAKLDVCAVLSANRNFEGRTHPDIRACYLASPALVIAFALAGTVLTDITTDPIGIGLDGEPVTLAEIWPDETEVDRLVREHSVVAAYRDAYSDGRLSSGLWQQIEVPDGDVFPWNEESSHVRRPPFFSGSEPRASLNDVVRAKPLAVLGDHITTDHISPFGRILPGSAAAQYLDRLGVSESDWSSYAERRGNHEVLSRGAFSNPRLRNRLAGDRAGSLTTGPTGEIMPIFEAAHAFKAAGTPTVIIAGKEYGTGSSRDWAAKATQLLGVRAVIAESFERIHRSNLVGLGVVPCQLPDGVSAASLDIDGDTEINIVGLSGINGPLATLRLQLTYGDGRTQSVPVRCRLDTEAELSEFRQGGLFAAAERAVG